MKECDKRKSHISSKLHMIHVSCNNVRHPVTKSFTTLHSTPLHYTCQHFTSSHLNSTQLHFTTVSFGLTPFKFPTAPFYPTSLHFTLLNFTVLLVDFRPLLFLSFHPIYNCFPNSVSNNLVSSAFEVQFCCMLEVFHFWDTLPSSSSLYV